MRMIAAQALISTMNQLFIINSATAKLKMITVLDVRIHLNNLKIKPKPLLYDYL